MAGNMQQRLWMALIGALAGASIYFLGKVIDENLLNERPALALVVFAGTFFTGILTMAGPLSIPRAAAGAAVMGVLTAALVSWAGLRFASIDGIVATPIPAVSGFVLAAIPMPFLIAAAGAGWRDYPTLFTQAWGIFVRTTLAWLFVGVVWGVVFLSDALFNVVGLTLIDDLLAMAIMPFLITGTVLGLALAVVMELSDVVSPYLLLRLLRLLLPVVLVVMVVFIAALPLQGLTGLFGELSVAATLLAMAAAAATLITATIDQTDAEATQAQPMRRAAQGLALILPVPALLGAWSVWQRVAQYGWTPDRLFAATVAVLGLGYGVLYALAVLRGAGWMARIRAANTAMALALIAVAALWLTPLLNPEAISARSQLARFEAGRTPVESLDLYAFSQWGFAGVAARAKLEAKSKESGNEALAARLADPNDSRFPPTVGIDPAPLRTALVAVMPLQPATATATRDMILGAAEPYDLQNWLTACQAKLPDGNPACVMIVADFLTDLPGEEAMLLTRMVGGYMVYDGLVLVDSVLQRRSILNSNGMLPDYAGGEALIAALQKTPPPLAPVRMNQISTANGGLMISP